MAMEIFKLIGSVFVDTDAADKSLSKTDKKAEGLGSTMAGAFSSIGKGAVAVGKTITTGLAVGGAAVAALTTQSVQAYADYEQLVGGVETLFDTSATKVQEYAANAYKTAGLSANEYMETVTSFSASLLQSLDGDTAEAAEKANMAITDMSDNANKMGTDMSLIQNAYQGFAKANYTMLDNLKLGYGGTKEEMQRLLEDAQAISGIEYDISSYADVVDAIHVIQTEMGVTGTTAKEASSTISGSTAAMKSSWQNLLTAISAGNLDTGAYVSAFVDSVSTVADNLVPAIETALDGIVTVINQLAPKIASALPKLVSTLLPSVVGAAKQLIAAVVEALPMLIEAIVDCVPDLIEAIVGIFDTIVEALPDLIEPIVEALPELIPALIDGLVSMLVTLCENFSDIVQPIIDNLPAIIQSVVDALIANLPAIIQGLITLVVSIISAIDQILLPIIEMMPTILLSILQALWDALPLLLDGLIQIMVSLGELIWSVLGAFFDAIGEFFSGLWEAVKEIFDPLIQWFSDLFSDAWEAVKDAFSAVGDFFSGIWDDIAGAFDSVITWFGDIFDDAWEAVKDAFSAVGDFFGGIWDDITEIFTNIGTEIGDAVSTAFSSAVNWVLETAIGIINGFISAINAAISLINKIPGVEISKIKKLDVPQLEEGGVLEKGQVGLLEGNGAEAVVPLEKNRAWTQAVARDMDSAIGGASGNQVVAVLVDILSALEEIAKMGLYIDKKTLVGGIAKEMDRQLGHLRIAKGRA